MTVDAAMAAQEATVKNGKGRNGHNGHAKNGSKWKLVRVETPVEVQALMRKCDEVKLDYNPLKLCTDDKYLDATKWKLELKQRTLSSDYGDPKEPMATVLRCPDCGEQHVDAVDPVTGIDWRRRPHKEHLCLACGYLWTPARIPTVGVEELP